MIEVWQLIAMAIWQLIAMAMLPQPPTKPITLPDSASLAGEEEKMSKRSHELKYGLWNSTFECIGH